MKKIKQFFLTMFGVAEQKTTEEPSKCRHKFITAGPTTSLKEILDKIDGVTYRENDSAELVVKVEGIRVWQEGVPASSWNTYPIEWYNRTVQGEVCIRCGECNDAIKETENFWKNKVTLARAEKRAELEDKLLAEQLWHECPERSK